MTILYTSLNEIESFNPCFEGWKDILKGQGKTDSDDILFPLVNCLESNSISDVCWLLGKRKIEIEICVKFAQDCADSVAHINNNNIDKYAAEYAKCAKYTAKYTARYAEYAEYAAKYAAKCAAKCAKYTEYADECAKCAKYTARYADECAVELQEEKNIQFLINRIREYEETH